MVIDRGDFLVDILANNRSFEEIKYVQVYKGRIAGRE